MTKLNLTFDPAAPLDATKLMSLVNAINELEAKTLQLNTDVAGLSNQNASRRMDAGIYPAGNINYSGKAIPFDITFNGPLITQPAAVTVTLETSTANADIVNYISNVTNTGFRVWINRVAGVSDKAVIASNKTFSDVKIHYVAFAKLEI